jgi:hypothetical protein
MLLESRSPGPNSISTTGPARSRQALRLLCLNAPPLASGFLRLSRSGDPAGHAEVDIRSFLATDPGFLLPYLPTQATRSGYCAFDVPALPPSLPQLHAQFVWTNPTTTGPGSPVRRSASDALQLTVL